MIRSTACQRVNETGYNNTGPNSATPPAAIIKGPTGMSGAVRITVTAIVVKMAKNVKMILIVRAPNSNASSPRRNLCPHRRHASWRENHPVKKALRSPHHAQRLVTPRSNNLGKEGKPVFRVVTVARYPAGLADSLTMERSLAGVLFLVASIAFALGAGGWWMQRIVFTPDGTGDSAAAILKEPDIRQEINAVVTGATSPVIGRSLADLGSFLETDILSTRAGGVMMAPTMEEIHNRIIGRRDDSPVTLTGTEMIDIVRDQKAGEASTVTLPIQPIGTLKTTRMMLGWMNPISAAIGAIALLLGIFTRPERRDVLRGLGEFGLAMAASMLLFGYLLPVHMLTAIDNSTWTHAIPPLALRTLPVVLGSAAIFAAGGFALVMASTSGGKRRQWSTPMSAGRYRSGSNPGWG